MNGGLREIQDNLARLSGDLDARRGALERNEAVDLSDLEIKIGEICIEVVNARPQSACFLPPLQQLMLQLDELAVALKRKYEKTG